MKRWHIEKAKPEHLPHIAKNMREADRREVWASSRHTPHEALATSLERAVFAWTCFIDDEPSIMFGVSRKTLISYVGVPWLLGTDDIHKVRVDFVKQSHRYVDRMQEAFPVMENFIHGENKLSIRWLKWCGFSIEDNPVLIGGANFYRFWRKTYV